MKVQPLRAYSLEVRDMKPSELVSSNGNFYEDNHQFMLSFSAAK